MKLIGRTLLILIAFLSHYYISGSLNVKNILTQISKGDLTKEDVIKFYNKDYDPMLEFHKIFTPCLNHLIDQEMKTESFISHIIQSVKEFFSSSYQEYAIPELGMKVKCETYINKLVSPDFIEKKKSEVLDLKRKLLEITQASMKFKAKEETSVESLKSRDKLTLAGKNQHLKYSRNPILSNKMKDIENNGELKFANFPKGVENNGELRQKKNDNLAGPSAKNNNVNKNENGVENNGELRQKKNDNLAGPSAKNNNVNKNEIGGNSITNPNVPTNAITGEIDLQNPLNPSSNNKNTNTNENNNNSCEDKVKKQKAINVLLTKENQNLQKSLHEKALEFSKVNDESCKCTDAKSKLETEITQLKKEKLDIEITNTKLKSKDDMSKVAGMTTDETKVELKKRIEENQKLNQEITKCKNDFEDGKKIAIECKENLQSGKLLCDKLLKENTDKLFTETNKITKELTTCSEKLEKCADGKKKNQKAQECVSALAKKEVEVKSLEENVKILSQKLKTSEEKLSKINPEIPAKKLKDCEDKISQSETTIIELKKKLADSDAKMNIMLSKAEKDTVITREKETEINNLKEDINGRIKLFSNLENACHKNTTTFETEIKHLTDESKALHSQVNDFTKKEGDAKAEAKSCNEKLNLETTKAKELLASKAALETKCNADFQRITEEKATIKSELDKFTIKTTELTEELAKSKDVLQKCQDINKGALKTCEDKCQEQLKNTKEQNDGQLKSCKQNELNLNNTCIAEKKDLNDKIVKANQGLSTCEVNSLKNLNEKKIEAEKCHTDLVKEKEENKNKYILKTDCESQVDISKKQIITMEAEMKTLKEKSSCPICPLCKMKECEEEKVKLTTQINTEKKTNEELKKSNIDMNSKIVLLSKSLTDSETRCKTDLAKAEKDCGDRLLKESNQSTPIKKRLTELEKENNILIEKNKGLSESQFKNENELALCRQQQSFKEKLDICLKDKTNIGLQVEKFKDGLTACEKNIRKQQEDNKKCETTLTQNKKQIEDLNKQVTAKTQEAEKSRTSQANKESECADLLIELKNKLFLQHQEIESMQTSMETNNIQVESFVNRLINQASTDDKTLNNLGTQIDGKIKLEKEMTNQITKGEKTALDLEKKKADIFNSLISRKSLLNANDIKILQDDMLKIENQSKLNLELLKKVNINFYNNQQAIGGINSEIAIIEHRKITNTQDKNSINNALTQHKDFVSKLKVLLNNNKTLRDKYSKKIEVVLKEAVKAGTLSDKFEKLFEEYKQRLAMIDTTVANNNLKFQHEVKTLSDRAADEKKKCLDEISAIKVNKDAKCFEELESITKKITEFNSSSSNNSLPLNNNVNTNELGGKTNNNPDLNSCLILMSNKTYTDNNCATLEPLRTKYNSLCRTNELLPPNKDILSFSTHPIADKNDTMYKRLGSKKF